MKKVYTYSDIRSLRSHPRFAELVSCPFITATADMAARLEKSSYGIDHICFVAEVQSVLFENWSSPSTSFSQFVRLSRLLSSHRVPSEESPIMHSFRKNCSDVLNAMRLLIEAGIEPDDLVPSCTEERIFAEVWSRMEDEEISFGELRSLFALLQSGSVDLNEVLGDHRFLAEAEKIVLQGFYFITPIQQRIFDILEEAGKELIFLCGIDRRFSGANEIWATSLRPDYGFPPESEWISDAPSVVPAMARFSQAFCSQDVSKDTVSRPARIIGYPDELALVEDIPRLMEKEFSILSTSRKDSDDMVCSFYPELFRRHSLLSYPVGQFIYRLHSMWDSSTHQLCVRFDDVRACFASGWVVINGLNGSDMLSDLDSLKTYVSDVTTVEDWRGRIALLKEVAGSVLPIFDKRIEEIGASDSKLRWHRLLGDPLLTLGCFSIGPDRLNELCILLEHLFDMIYSLFGTEDEVDIAKHLRRLRSMLDEKRRSEDVDEEQKAVLEALITRITLPQLTIKRCFPDELSQALCLIVGDGILNTDEAVIETGPDQHCIHSFDSVEAQLLVPHSAIHLCLADSARLPGPLKSYTWPLSRAFLERCSFAEDDRRKVYISELCTITEDNALAARYLFSQLLRAEKLEISWVTVENDRTKDPSPYIDIICDLYGLEVEKDPRRLESVGDIPVVDPLPIWSLDTEDGRPIEVLMDAVHCPWRYLYGYVLADHPSFVSDFHFSFVLSSLIGALSTSMGLKKDIVGKHVLDLFPYLRPVERQQIIDYASADEQTDLYDGVEYPTQRLKVHFLNSRFLEALQDEMTDRLVASSKLKLDLYARASQECTYCPYSDRCPHKGVGEVQS